MNRRPSKTSLILGSLFALFMFIVLLALGTWQLDRLRWKEALIAARSGAATAEPIVLDAAALTPEILSALPDYRHVRVSGRFDHAHEFHLTSQFRDGKAGYHILTPLLLDGGTAVVIDRGYVPLDRVAASTRQAGQIEGTQQIDGLLIRPHGPGSFTPANQPEQNLWFFVDLPAMAKAAGLESLPAAYIAAGPTANPGGYPISGDAAEPLRNDHLQYAITWYGLAFLLVVIYLLYCRRILIENRTPSAP